LDLGVDPDLVQELHSAGICNPFPIQRATIPDALAGLDLCGKAKTGSGKTLAFGIPLIQRLRQPTSGSAALGAQSWRGLVLVPTRELALQVGQVLAPLVTKADLTLMCCYGGTSMESQIEAAKAGGDLIVATPGRLIDLVQREVVGLAGVQVLVIDEADRMADLGFTPQVEWILRHLPRQRQTMLFSATLDGEVERLVRHDMNNPVRHEVSSTTMTVASMRHRFIKVHQMDKLKVVAAICSSSARSLVFCRTKREADRVSESLRRLGVDARPIHGDLRQSLRERTLRGFSTGRLKVLVATDVAARGLDVEGVEVVVHFDLPEDHKAYLHRSGRTARAGAGGTVVTLVLWNQQLEVERLQKRLGLSLPIVEMFSNDARLADLGAWEASSSS